MSFSCCKGGRDADQQLHECSQRGQCFWVAHHAAPWRFPERCWLWRSDGAHDCLLKRPRGIISLITLITSPTTIWLTHSSYIWRPHSSYATSLSYLPDALIYIPLLHVCIHTNTHAQTYAARLARTTRMHAYTHTCTWKSTHTNTHTYTQIYRKGMRLFETYCFCQTWWYSYVFFNTFLSLLPMY